MLRFSWVSLLLGNTGLPGFIVFEPSHLVLLLTGIGGSYSTMIRVLRGSLYLFLMQAGLQGDVVPGTVKGWRETERQKAQKK